MRTPDGRYLIVRGRLWRLADPSLDPARKEALVLELMAARRALRGPTDDLQKTRAARARVEAAKRALGERGPVWWDDGAPDYNRRKVAHTPYAEWFAALEAATPGHRSDAEHLVGPPAAVEERKES